MLLMRQQMCSRRPIQAPTGVFPPNESAGLSARSCVTSHVHEALLQAIFAPAGHRLNVFLTTSIATDSRVIFHFQCSKILRIQYCSTEISSTSCVLLYVLCADVPTNYVLLKWSVFFRSWLRLYLVRRGRVIHTYSSCWEENSDEPNL